MLYNAYIIQGRQLAWYHPARVALQMSLLDCISWSSCAVSLFLMTPTSTDKLLSFTLSRMAVSLPPTTAGGNGTST